MNRGHRGSLVGCGNLHAAEREHGRLARPGHHSVKTESAAQSIRSDSRGGHTQWTRLDSNTWAGPGGQPRRSTTRAGMEIARQPIEP
jgi:hypothetical protein